jgi:conjugative transfer signal peptidase TraF
MLGALTLMAGSTAHPRTRLIYNASDSAPRGFYAVVESANPQVGDLVIAALPASIRRFAAARGYLPDGVPVLKRVAAVERDFVCVHDDAVLVDQQAIARTGALDGAGRPMPIWTQCRVLMTGEVFLIGVSSPASFDSRYFGPIDASFVQGRAIPWLTTTGK